VRAVAGAEQLGVRPEPALQLERNEPRDGPIGQRFNRLVRRVGVNLDAFLLRQVAQEVEALG
jgi:hypothetical protein